MPKPEASNNAFAQKFIITRDRAIAVAERTGHDPEEFIAELEKIGWTVVDGR